MEQAITFYEEEKVRSCTISFKLKAVDFALKKSISNTALKYKIDIQVVSGRKKNELQEFSNSVNKKKRKHLQGEKEKEKENQLLQ